MIAYSRHSADSLTRIRFSRGPENISSWSSEKTTRWLQNVTYTQLHRVGQNIWIFARQRPGWSFVRSTDNGETWSSPQRWITGSRHVYQTSRIAPDERTLIVALHDHPDSGSDQSIYRIDINLIAGQITNSETGAVLDNLQLRAHCRFSGRTVSRYICREARSGITPLGRFLVCQNALASVYFGSSTILPGVRVDINGLYFNRLSAHARQSSPPKNV